jgi:hypothetical protein
VKVEPSPSSLATAIAPPCCSITFCTRLRPSPVPAIPVVFAAR